MAEGAALLEGGARGGWESERGTGGALWAEVCWKEPIVGGIRDMLRAGGETTVAPGA